MVRLCVHDDAIRQAHGCVRRGCNRACGSRDYRMDQPPTAPLTPDEATARLLEAVDRCSPPHWLRAHPWGSVADWLAPVIVSELAYNLEHAIKQKSER